MTVAARVPPELAEEVARLADRGRRSLSSEIRWAIEEHVSRSAGAPSAEPPRSAGVRLPARSGFPGAPSMRPYVQVRSPADTKFLLAHNECQVESRVAIHAGMLSARYHVVLCSDCVRAPFRRVAGTVEADEPSQSARDAGIRKLQLAHLPLLLARRTLSGATVRKSSSTPKRQTTRSKLSRTYEKAGALSHAGCVWTATT